MALQFHVQELVTSDAIDTIAPMVLAEMMKKLLAEARPDWETVKLTIEPPPVNLYGKAWLVRLEAEGGTHDCIVRGGPDGTR